MNKQEDVSDWMEMAKEYKRAEKETIVPYVHITIEDSVTVHHLSFYDKKTGLNLGLGTLLSKLTNAKAKVTLLGKKMESYKELMKDDLFFDETSDKILAKFKCKIDGYKTKIKDYEDEIKQKMKELDHENTSTCRPI